MNHGCVHDFVHGFVYGLVHGVLHNVLLEDGGLPCIFPFNVQSTLTLDIIVTLVLVVLEASI